MNLLFQFACAFSLGVACWSLGDFVFSRFYMHNRVMTRLARHTLSFALGNVFFSYLLTILGFGGLFNPSVFWAVFLLGIGLGIWRVSALFFEGGWKGFFEPWRKTSGSKLPALFLVCALGPFFLLSVLQAAAPPYLRDSLVYHLLCPKEYLKASSITHVPGNIFSAFPKGQEVLMTLLLSISGDRAAQSFSILQQVAAIGSLYSVARLMGGPWLALLCSLGYGTIPPVVYFSGCGYMEPALLMALGASVLALLFYIKASGDEKERVALPHFQQIALLGFISGWMVALKYSGLIYFGLIALIVLWRYRKAAFKEAIRLIGTFVLTASPGLCWMVWNWVTLGNPVYPMGWTLFGGKGWDGERAFAMSLYFDRYGMGRDLIDYFKLPWRLAFSGKFDSILFDGSVGPFLILFLILGLISIIRMVRHRAGKPELSVPGFLLIGSAAFFLFGTQQARFWLPSQLLLCLVAAPGLTFLISLGKDKRWINPLLGLVVVLCISWNLWFLVSQVYSTGYYKPALGLESDPEFLARKIPGYPAMEYVNQKLTDQDRVLCVWTGAYGYYLNRPYYSDTFIEDATLKGLLNSCRDGRELSERLAQSGFTHLFFQVSLLIENMTPGQQALFVDFLRKGAAQVFSYRDFWIFEIRTNNQNKFDLSFNYSRGRSSPFSPGDFGSQRKR